MIGRYCPPVTGERAARTTVVIPVWDRYVGPQLVEALASVAEQEDARPTVVVVDNASNTPLPPLPGARVFRSERRLTLGAARNLGLAQARTPYVLCWDADDVMLPGTLTLLERELDADPRVVAAGAAILEEPSGRRHRWPRPWIAGLTDRPRLMASIHSVWSIFPTTGATLMRAEQALSGGGYSDADSGDDWCLGVSLLWRGPVRWSERPGRVYRLHDDSIWGLYGGLEHQRRHAAVVRARIRSDRGIPTAVRLALPLIAAAQWSALAAHAALAGIRQAGRGASRRDAGASRQPRSR